MRRNRQNDHTNSHVATSTPAQQNASSGGPNNMQSNRGQGSYRASDALAMVKLAFNCLDVN